MFWGTWILVSSPLPVIVARATPDGMGTRRWLTAHALGSLLATATHLGLAAVVFWASTNGQSLATWALQFALDLSLRDLTIYWALLGSLVAWQYHLRSQERELEAARWAARAGRLEAAAQSARLEMLRRQLQPHFLFNALHAVGALVRRQERDRALEALERIGELLREGFDPRSPDMTSLDDEIRRVQQYLGLEEIRFGDRLQVSWKVDDEARSRLVPSLILQPLVENAVKHGIGQSAGPVSITIAGRVVGDHTCLFRRGQWARGWMDPASWASA